jgi:hypothetical protein
MAGLSALGGSGLLAGKSLAVLGAGLLSGAVAGGALVARHRRARGQRDAGAGAGSRPPARPCRQGRFSPSPDQKV